MGDGGDGVGNVNGGDGGVDDGDDSVGLGDGGDGDGGVGLGDGGDGRNGGVGLGNGGDGGDGVDGIGHGDGVSVSDRGDRINVGNTGGGDGGDAHGNGVGDGGRSGGDAGGDAIASGIADPTDSGSAGADNPLGASPGGGGGVGTPEALEIERSQRTPGVSTSQQDAPGPDAGITINEADERIHKLAMFTTLSDVLGGGKPQPTPSLDSRPKADSLAGRRMRPLTAPELWAEMVPKMAAVGLMRRKLRESKACRIRVKMMVSQTHIVALKKCCLSSNSN